MTYSASGLYALRVSRVIVIDIPVANGRIIKSFMHDNPMIFLKMLRVIALVSFTMRDDPTAFGYNAFTSPDLPIP